eukprot:scaffold271278_cov30-Tisochrysis_lutea.AAC.2
MGSTAGAIRAVDGRVRLARADPFDPRESVLAASADACAAEPSLLLMCRKSSRLLLTAARSCDCNARIFASVGLSGALARHDVQL